MIWSTATGDSVGAYKCDWSEYIHWTFDIKYSPDGKYIAAVAGHVVNILESETLKLLWSRSSSNNDITACRFSSDGARFLTDDGKAPNLQFVDRGAGSVVWDVATGKVIDRSGDCGTEAGERLREYEHTVTAGRYASELGPDQDPRSGEEWTSWMQEDGNSGVTEVTLWDASKQAQTFWLQGIVSGRFQLPRIGEWLLIMKGGRAPIRAKIAWP